MLVALAAALFQWVVLGPGGEAVVRAVVEEPDARCPIATVSGVERPLQLRYGGGPGFPITICELRLPASVTSATLRGAPLPLPKEAPSRIVALGDTGCRVKRDEAGGLTIQNCDNVAGTAADDRWPLRAIAEAAAAASPDLVIHLGDYVYRKAACPSGEPRCAATNAYGANWATLKAELFEPAAALLAKAPWVVPRGNHESCDTTKAREAQGGAPFLLLLDPRPLDQLLQLVSLDPYLRSLQAGAIADARAPCRANYEPYVVSAGPALDLWVLDSSEPEDDAASADDDLAQVYALQLRRLSEETAAHGKDRAWLLTHRPLFGGYPGSRSKKRGKVSVKELNVTLQKALDGAGRPAELDLALSGHLHVFQALSFDSGKLPAQLVVGTGGTALDTHFRAVPDLVDLGRRRYLLPGKAGRKGEKVHGLTEAAFGFVLLERKGEAWTAALVDPAGKRLVSCAAEGRLRSLRCTREK